ncbi:MAG: lytic transglycosylase domain-containing protein [Coriobacteriia bacterium]|nr:lytic transglycosylase domain-containing protein [Coriobacteriia bacterium]
MSRTTPAKWAFRIGALGAVVSLGVLTALFLRGPAFWQKQYYPLHYQSQIAASAARHRVSPYVVAAVINAESGWKPGIHSSVGAVGLMQVMPQTARDLASGGIVDAKEFPPSDLTSPTVNIEYGTAYIRYLVNRYHEIETALSAYNAGLRHADAWAKQGGNIRAAIEFPETKAYVPKVMRGRDRYQALYPTSFN